jgi:hypothetical protein
MKAVVFQYRDDGTLLDELTIAGTGAHHVLSGAEAIVRGEHPALVYVLLCAHAAPSLGDEVKVASWCRAAAMIAGVDAAPLLPDRPPVEGFISHLSDHDYVLSIPAAHAVSEELARIAPSFGIDVAKTGDLNWWRLSVRAHAPDVALYHELLTSESAFVAAVRRAIA